ncbi:MAG: site-specific integrase [Clostridia bacterium]|nr:site-specific integrase [Clostridia bacterium]
MPRRGESIYKRKDGRWEARYIHHYENGKAKYRFLYAPTYAEVRAKRTEELQSPENRWFSNIKSTSDFKEISMQWLVDIKMRVKESTYTRYFRIVNVYLNPEIGEIKLQKLDICALNKFVQYLSNEGGCKKQGLSTKTVSDILCVLKAILSFGKQHGYPCDSFQGLCSPKKSQKPTEIVSKQHLMRIEDTLKNKTDLTSLGILFALYTGVRIGELCGLQWQDIDLESKTVTIRRTVERIADLSHGGKKTKVIVSMPKTESAVRLIPLPTFLVDLLAEHTCAPSHYFLTGTEKYIEPHQYYMRYKSWMKKLGLHTYTFHALRHTFATRCVEIGFDTKSLSEILGHANVSTTLSVYVHPTLEQKRTQIEKLAKCYS